MGEDIMIPFGAEASTAVDHRDPTPCWRKGWATLSFFAFFASFC
jgi:hypothetical protein